MIIHSKFLLFRKFICRQTTTVCGLALLVATFATGEVNADVIDKFDDVLGAATGELGWDDYNGAGYAGPHTPDQFATGGAANMTATPGGLFDAGNLYSFFTTPSYAIQLSGFSDTNSFTSIAVQVATTDIMNASRFSIGGNGPDEFINLGQRFDLDFDGDSIPVNFYWAEWIGLTANTDYTVDLSQGFAPHVVMTGTKVSYFNTTSLFNITNVPEPGSAVVLGALGLGLLMRRRRK